MANTENKMDKHPDDVVAGDGDPFKGDPNFMASLARGLEVIQAFTPQRPVTFASAPACGFAVDARSRNSDAA